MLNQESLSDSGIIRPIVAQLSQQAIILPALNGVLSSFLHLFVVLEDGVACATPARPFRLSSSHIGFGQ